MRRPSARAVVVAAAAVTLTVAVADQARPALLQPVRTAAAQVWSPVQRALEATDDRVATTTEQRDRASLEAGQLRRTVAEDAAVERLLGSASATGHRLRPARVVGFETNPATAVVQRVSLDVGTADGIGVDRAVVSADGLVGRVDSVTRSSCTVVLVTDRSSIVAARVGSGALATVTGSAPLGAGARRPGLLSLQSVAGTAIAAGQPVVTLGSLGGRPFPAGLVIGTVVSVDRASDVHPPSGAVRPAVDPSRLDIVGVLTS